MVRGGGRTQPNSQSDESPSVLGARGDFPLCLSPFSSTSLALLLSPISRLTPLFSHLNPSHPLSLLSRTTMISLSPAPRGSLSPSRYPLRRLPSLVATTPSPTLPIAFSLSTPTKPPTSTEWRRRRRPVDCWAFPSRPRSFYADSLYLRLFFILSLHRATGIYPRHFLLPSLPFSFLDRVLSFFLISCSRLPRSLSPHRRIR